MKSEISGSVVANSIRALATASELACVFSMVSVNYRVVNAL